MIYQRTWTNAEKREKTITDFVVLVVISLLSPMLLIWAINGLFPAAEIALTVKTWFCAFVLIALAGGEAGK
jgi:hypothetical protein